MVTTTHTTTQPNYYCYYILLPVLGVTRYVILLLLWQLSNITKYAIKTGNITYKCNALPK